MAEQPERLVWATDTFTEIRDLGTGDGLQPYDNKFTPPIEVQLTGFKVRQNWYRPFVNSILNNIFRQIDHLTERYAVGDIHITKSIESEVDISIRLGGTWVARGTDTVGTEAVNVFEKIA